MTVPVLTPGVAVPGCSLRRDGPGSGVVGCLIQLVAALTRTGSGAASALYTASGYAPTRGDV
jgi:hypothetical protein